MDLTPEPYLRQNYITAIRNIYPGISDDIVDNVIEIAEENSPLDSYEGKLEIMLNLLSEYGAWGPPSSTINEELFNQYYNTLMELFPDANPDYILQLCRDQPTGFILEDAIQKLCTGINFLTCQNIHVEKYVTFRGL